jgi:hypothetical protein
MTAFCDSRLLCKYYLLPGEKGRLCEIKTFPQLLKLSKIGRNGIFGKTDEELIFLADRYEMLCLCKTF